MTKHTHLAVATALTVIPIYNSPLSVLGLIGSTLPDVDLRIGIPHRTLTHCLIFAVVTSIIALSLNIQIGIIYAISIVSHLVLDSYTRMGIPLFYPYKKKMYGARKVLTHGREDCIILVISLLLIAAQVVIIRYCG